MGEYLVEGRTGWYGRDDALERSRLRLFGRCLIFGAAIILGSCATRPPDPKPICIAVKEYTKAEQQALAAALKDRAADDIVLKVVMDYGQLRDGLRACAASR